MHAPRPSGSCTGRELFASLGPTISSPRLHEVRSGCRRAGAAPDREVAVARITHGYGIAVVPFSCHAPLACNSPILEGSEAMALTTGKKARRARFSRKTGSRAGCLAGTTPIIAICRGEFAPAALTKGVRPDPYHVWLSKIMLQRNDSRGGKKPYFRKFLEKWPRSDGPRGGRTARTS